jgi:hypothetical protein
MKLLPQISRRTQGYTLFELMIGSFIYCVILGGTSIGLLIMGLRVYTLSGTKLSASMGAIKVLGQIRNDIRASKQEYVGNLSTPGDPTTFGNITVNGINPMQGSALQICSTSTNGPPEHIYYLDTSGATNALRVYVNDGVDPATNYILALYVTNQVVFTEEDPFENIQTNYANNRIIRMELDFYQWEYPVGMIGGSTNWNAYDFYRVTTRISRRMID